MSDASDRSIPATPKRREMAHRQGMLASATLPAWAASLAAALALLPAWWRATLPAAVELLRQAFSGQNLRPAGPVSLPPLAAVVLPTVAVAAVAIGVGLAVRLLLDRPVWSPQRACPAWQRIDPLAGLARMASWDTLVSLGLNAVALFGLVAAAVWSAGPLVALLSAADGSPLAGQLVAGAGRAMVPLMGASAVVAVCQWALVRRRSELRIRMTPEEFKDELRSLQSDAKVRWQRQRSARRAA